MPDCPDAEIRDLLPELVHERLDAPTLARVLAHVAVCDDCRAEVALLRALRGALAPAVHVDVAAIVTRLPQPGAPRARRGRLAIIGDWRVAAAVAAVVVGGGSFALLAHRAADRVGAGSVPTAAVATIAGRSTAAASATEPAAPLEEPGDDLAARTDRELQSLLSDLDTLEALQAPEPDLVSSLVDSPYGT